MLSYNVLIRALIQSIQPTQPGGSYLGLQNIIAPINWSPYTNGYGSGVFSGSSPSTTFVKTLDDAWDGQAYIDFSSFNFSDFNHCVFSFNNPKIINELHIEVINSGDAPIVVLYDAMGNIFGPSSYQASSSSAPGINGGTIWRIILNETDDLAPTSGPVSKFAVLGFGEYPQGLPDSILGMYASLSEPP